MYSAEPVETTVSELFRCLEHHGIRYAIIRNYEQLPKLLDIDFATNTDLDLVMDARDIPLWRLLAARLAADLGWDCVTECDHWAQSPIRDHHIEVFQFYRISPPGFLQVDVFHSYLIWGVPLLDEAEMLEGRTYDPKLRLTHIDPAKENLHRLLSIYGLQHGGSCSIKTVRYRKRTLAFASRRDCEFRTFLRKKFSIFGVRALRALQAGDERRFARQMHLARLFFFARFGLRHPLGSALYLQGRRQCYRSRFVERQCGVILRMHAPRERERGQVCSALDRLVQLNVIGEWTDSRAGDGDIPWSERKVMEQGGIVIKWSAADAADICVSEAENEDIVQAEVMKYLLVRHRALFTRDAPTR